MKKKLLLFCIIFNVYALNAQEGYQVQISGGISNISLSSGMKNNIYSEVDFTHVFDNDLVLGLGLSYSQISKIRISRVHSFSEDHLTNYKLYSPFIIFGYRVESFINEWITSYTLRLGYAHTSYFFNERGVNTSQQKDNGLLIGAGADYKYGLIEDHLYLGCQLVLNANINLKDGFPQKTVDLIESDDFSRRKVLLHLHIGICLEYKF